MIITASGAPSNTLLGREYVLCNILAAIIEDYQAKHEAACLHEEFLEAKIQTLKSLAAELAGLGIGPPQSLNHDCPPL